MARGTQQPPALWSANHRVYPWDFQADIFAADGSPPYLVAHGGQRIQIGILDRFDQGHFLYSQALTGASVPVLVTNDLHTGFIRQELQLPQLRQNGGFLRITALQAERDPEGGHVLAWNTAGWGVWIGEADARLRPTVQVGQAYPRLREPFSLEVSAPGAIAIDVAWGDGSLQHAKPGEVLSRAFSKAADLEARVTAIYADNRTGTTVVYLHPGMPAPVELSALQLAFAPENQNLTFGLLGLFLTLAGAMVALWSRSRRRSVIAREFESLEAIRALGRSDPLAAIAAVAGFRRRLKQDLTQGRLDDSQFAALELDVRELQQLLRQRILGDVGARLSGAFANALDVALQDGRLEGPERAELTRRLAGEAAVTVTERRRLAGLLRDWPLP